ncbi:MAG: hypothetical protein KC636_35845 [Myxococcales bacterium]|nr:hypothetical protein [Myxococcales bacterium]
MSTRPLAVRTEVIDPLPIGPPEDTEALGVRCEALPLETVRAEPLIVDPDGTVDPATIDPLWIACELPAGQGLFSCLKGALPLELAAIPECPVITLADLDPEALADLSFPEFPSPCVVPEDATPGDGLRDITVPLSLELLIGGDLELTLVGHGPGDVSTETCADALLAGETAIPEPCILAVQRLSVGPTEQLFAIAETLGVELPGGLTGAPLADDPPDGDRNPRIVSFTVAIEHEDGSTEEAVDVAAGDTITAQLGDVLKIVTEAPETDLQTYLVPINGGADGFEDREETYNGRWFRTWGRTLSGSSNDPTSMNEWTLRPHEDDETDRPEGDRATLFYVLRDDRRGVAWWWFHVDVAE